MPGRISFLWGQFQRAIITWRGHGKLPHLPQASVLRGSGIREEFTIIKEKMPYSYAKCISYCGESRLAHCVLLKVSG